EPRRYRHDLSLLGGEALELALILSPTLRRYWSFRIKDILLGAKDWNISWRYAATGNLPEDQINSIFVSAKKAYETLVIPLILDGLEDLP
ncbi:MAG: hypothetical protein AB1798_19600, partial [Spirochaetota bacterium]